MPDDEPTDSLVRVHSRVLEHERLRLHARLHPDLVLRQHAVRSVLRLDERRMLRVLRQLDGAPELEDPPELFLSDGVLRVEPGARVPVLPRDVSHLHERISVLAVRGNEQQRPEQRVRVPEGLPAGRELLIRRCEAELHADGVRSERMRPVR